MALLYLNPDHIYYSLMSIFAESCRTKHLCKVVETTPF